MPRAALALAAALLVAVPCTASQAAGRTAPEAPRQVRALAPVPASAQVEAPVPAREPVAVPDAPAPAPASSVAVSIPAGSLTLSVEGDVLTVSDTRPGNLGFSVVVTAARATTLGGARAEQVPGNAMRAEDLAVARGPVHVVPGAPVTVASFPAGLSLGTVRLRLAEPADGLTWTVL